jgi:hypothetical protein
MIQNNQGISAKINTKQRLFSKKWIADANQFIQKEFRTVERLYTIEFERLESGNHSSWKSKLTNFLNFKLKPSSKPN